jgi:hypothetical protein
VTGPLRLVPCLMHAPTTLAPLQDAAQELGSVRRSANQTLGALEAAAAALSSVGNGTAAAAAHSAAGAGSQQAGILGNLQVRFV